MLRRPSLRRLSLRSRLLLGVLVLAAAGLGAADLATYSALRSFLIGRVDASLTAGHTAVEQRAFAGGAPAGQRESGEGGREPPEFGPPAAGIDWFAIRRFDGRVVRSGFLVGGGSPPKLPARIVVPRRASGPDGERTVFLTVPSRGGTPEYRLRVAIEHDHPHRLLVVAASLGDVVDTLHRLVAVEALATLAALAGILGLGFWVVRLGLRPLREIERTAAAITAGDLSQRVERLEPQTEVGRVGSALNTMLDHLEASDRRLRRFVADASHELRTPLASVRAYAELFGRGAAARPADLERAMSGIRREAERMSVLVDDLLLLARLDEGRPLERAPVALDTLVAEAVDAARVVDPERPYELALEPAVVEGDAGRLRQVVDNLLANARAHTPAGTRVRVHVRREGNEAVLEVADHGPGLGEDEAQRVFERFYRADASRARASGGVGLGLAIVAAVAQAHGGRAETRPTPGGGATFVVSLPLRDAQPPARTGT